MTNNFFEKTNISLEQNTMHTLPQTHGAILGGGGAVGSRMQKIEWRVPSNSLAN